MNLNKEFFYKKIDEIFTDNKSKDVFKKQVDTYISLKNSNVNNRHQYKIGENVKLFKGMFMRGEGSLSKLDDEKL